MKMPVENHFHFAILYALPLEKGWNAAQSFRVLNELVGEGTKDSLKDGSRSSNWTMKMKC